MSGLSKSKKRKNLLLGLAFLGPNIIGFMAFTLVPLVLSMVLAFSNWDLTRHNMFHTEDLKFVGLDNFIRLFNEPDFFRYFGNTLFLMMGIPFGIAGSLFLATLLTRDMRGGSRKMFISLVCASVLAAGVAMMLVVGAERTAMTIMITGIAGIMLVGGVAGGSAVYRTLFFLPSFTAGVAVYILWMKLYNPNTGPINQMLAGPLLGLSHSVKDGAAWPAFAMWACFVLMTGTVIFTLRKLRLTWKDGDLGTVAAIVPLGFVLLPTALGYFKWLPNSLPMTALAGVTLAWLIWQLVACRKGADFKSAAGNGFGSAVMLAMAAMVIQFILLGLACAFGNLPTLVNQALAAGNAGIAPPQWLTNYTWAKPAIMIMGIWMGIGSNNMLLYIAGLSNIPPELYEAGDIDGTSGFQRFWHITWPQLAPTTFFIVVMSVIGGLQGGFEQARVMTGGGPAGSTTTLSYFIYNEGFETGRLGYSSAIAWTLFALVFSVTLFNWKFGNRYVND